MGPAKGESVIAKSEAQDGKALFLLSFRQRDELVEQVERAGWSPVAAQSPDRAETRFLQSGARIALVDARGAAEDGIETVRHLADAAQANGAALLVLLSKTDIERIEAFFEAGATHFLASPFGESELVQALRFAERHADRVERRFRKRTAADAADLTVATGPLPDTDPLTGVAGAGEALGWIEEKLDAGEQAGRVAVLLVGLHRFDRINSAFGPSAGDAVLEAMARRIDKIVADTPSEESIVGRLAGAEFVVGLAPDISRETAQLLARQLGTAIDQPFAFGDTIIGTKMRCGVVLAETGKADAVTAIRQASLALAEAREPGAGSIRFFGGSQSENAARENRLEIDLRRALASDEIEILFQPQVAIASGEIVGTEALARWKHPEFGELGAAALFAAAERSDYLVELSAHIHRRALSEAAHWPEPLATLSVSLNVTAADMRAGDFAQRFCDMVEESNVAADRITLEVTESSLIEDLEGASEEFATLREKGFRVAVDDFGTGYSSLAYLNSLPLDAIKIDRRLSQGVAGSERERVVLRGAIEMAKSLNLSIVAEGVETEEQRARLGELGCDLYQGFLCAPPLSSEALAARIVQSASE